MNLMASEMKSRRGRYSTLFVLIVTAVCTSYPALARLGESYSECDARYGKPDSIRIEDGAQVRRYHKRGVEVAVWFWKSKSVELTYRKLNRHLMSEKEQRLFLSVNVATSNWSKIDQVLEWQSQNPDAEGDAESHAELMEDLASFYLWAREDGKAEASYDRRDGILLISDVDHLERLAAEQETDASNPPDETHGF